MKEIKEAYTNCCSLSTISLYFSCNSASVSFQGNSLRSKTSQKTFRQWNFLIYRSNFSFENVWPGEEGGVRFSSRCSWRRRKRSSSHSAANPGFPPTKVPTSKRLVTSQATISTSNSHLLIRGTSPLSQRFLKIDNFKIHDTSSKHSIG